MTELQECQRQKDAAYEERNRVVAAYARMALALGYPVVVAKTAIEGWSDDWQGCVYVCLPWGQASWHFHDSQAHLFADLPRGEMTWDGTTTDEKYAHLHTWQPVEAQTFDEWIVKWIETQPTEDELAALTREPMGESAYWMRCAWNARVPARPGKS